jgi:hypothetical protein
MTGYRVWMESPDGKNAGFASPHFEKRERAEKAANEMRKQWGEGGSTLTVKTDEWKEGDHGYFGSEKKAKPL